MDGRGDGEGSLSKDVLGHQGVNALEDVDGSVNVLRVDAKVGFSGLSIGNTSEAVMISTLDSDPAE